MSGNSIDSQQKSVEQKETEFHSQEPQSSTDSLIQHTKCSETQVNTESEEQQSHRQPMVSEADGAESHLQDTDEKDMNIAHTGIAEDCVKESTSSQDSGQVDSLMDMDVAQKDIAEDHVRESTQSQDTDCEDCFVDVHVVQKDITEDYVKESTAAQDDSESTLPVVVPEGHSQMKVLKASPSSPFDLKSSVTQNEESSSTQANQTSGGGLYSGRSVSVQMRSSLPSVSQSSLRGDLIHSSSLGPRSPSARESFSRRVHSDGNENNLPDSLHSPTTPAPSEQADPSPQPWRSQESSKGLQNFQFRSTSLDMGISYEEDRRWVGTGTQCCCSCDHNCRCCCQNRSSQKPCSISLGQLHPASSLPYSLDELESMMRCMRKFRRVLSEIEERLEEEQTSVLGSFSDAHRAEVQDVLELRTAVKQEAVLLEQQLTDLVHAYDDGIKMKLNRLLDEQSQLCSQLQITPSDTHHPAHTASRSVGIQCCLQPMMDTLQKSINDHVTPDGEWTPRSKADKLDFVGFIKSLKDVTISNDSLE